MMGLSDREGVVRLMLVEIKEQGLISSSRLGCMLTERGRIVLEKRLRDSHITDIKLFDPPILKIGSINVGVHFHDMGDVIDSTMEIRDIAVRGGATGALIIFFKEEKLSIPSVPNFFSEYPNLVIKLQSAFNLSNNDVVVIISGENQWRALEASIILAQTLVKK
jgi:hypothetical protein